MVSQQQLPMPDPEGAKPWRIQAETALRDPFRGPRERQERHDYYMRKAEEAERGTRSPAR